MIYFYFMILVTGGTGLIGSHLLYELTKKGEPIRALRRKESNTAQVRKVFSYYSPNADELLLKIEWMEGDLLDIISLEEAMKGVTQVYHCAALISLNSQEEKKMMDINVKGTANIVNIAMEKKVKRFCHVSSVAALGTNKGKEITEEIRWQEQTHSSAYSLSKYLAENEVWRASQEGLDVVILSPTIVVGPGNWHRSSGLIFKTASKGLRWYSTGGMGFVDVRDLSKAMVMVTEAGVKNENFIISSENLSFRKFSEMVCASLGKNLPNKKARKFFLELGRIGDMIRSAATGSSRLLTKNTIRHASSTLSYSNAKIKKAIAIEFMPISRSVKDASHIFLSDHKRAKK